MASNITTTNEYFTLQSGRSASGPLSALLANDITADGSALTVVSLGSPAHGTLVRNADGTITYTPATGFVGQDSFTYTVRDGSGNLAQATAYLNVTAPPTTNVAPVAQNDSYTLQANQSVTGSPNLFLSNDRDADGDALSVVAVGPAAVGTLVRNADGTVTYTPRANYTGVDSFTYTVSDGNGHTSTATVTLNIVGNVSTAPTARADSATLGADHSVDINVLANDSGGSGALHVASVTQGRVGQVWVGDNNQVHYELPKPEEFAAGTTGTYMDRIAQTIADDAGLRASGTVSGDDMRKALESVNRMNAIILEAIQNTGSGGSGEITLADVVRINGYIRANHSAEWVQLHGDDEAAHYKIVNGSYVIENGAYVLVPASESGYHLVQGDGGSSTAFNANFVNTVADGIYHIGFAISGNSVVNEDGTANATLDKLAEWLTLFYKDRSTAGNGLDVLTERMLSDNGLLNSGSSTGQDMAHAADSMTGMNRIIGEAIRATGVATDGKISSSDVVLLNEYIRGNHLAEWTQLHGDDSAAAYKWVNGQYVLVPASETGFHLVQNDGSNQTMFGQNLVNTVADGIYHLGFGIANGRFYNEDGDANATTSDVADWLNYFYVDHSTTGSGLDTLVDDMSHDKGLTTSTRAGNVSDGLASANGMNQIIVEGVQALGLARDGYVSVEDVLALNQWIRANRLTQWTALHGDDAGATETGFHKIQGNGGTDQLYGDALVNTVADGLYHLGFEVKDGRFVNEDGTANATVGAVAGWLNHYLVGESAMPVYDTRYTASGNLHTDGYGKTNEDAYGTTGTYMDRIADTIGNDAGLRASGTVTGEEINKALDVVNRMTAIIVEAITRTGSGTTGEITLADVVRINSYIRTNYSTQWAELHGDDEAAYYKIVNGAYVIQNGAYVLVPAEETGYHLVQNDGATTQMFNANFVNTVVDGLYHLGFAISGNNVVNEDGTANATLDQLAEWLTLFYKDRSTAGNGLDSLTERMLADAGLLASNTAKGQDLVHAADSMTSMNRLIGTAVQATGVAADGRIDSGDVVLLNEYIRNHNQAEWKQLHGDDSAAAYQWVNGQYVLVPASETGFHLVQNDGANQTMFGQNLVNTVADGIYHLGFGIANGRFYNEDGDANATTTNVAEWLNYFYVDHSTSGSGLDALVDAMSADAGLTRATSATQVTDGLAAANGMNKIILEAVQALGVARDGYVSDDDVLALNQWIRANRSTEWATLHGDDQGATETGFHKLQGNGGTEQLFGEALVNTVADGLYHLGFQVKDGRFYNEDGAANATVGDVATWLNYFLVEHGRSAVYNAASLPSSQTDSFSYTVADANGATSTAQVTVNLANPLNNTPSSLLHSTAAGEVLRGTAASDTFTWHMGDASTVAGRMTVDTVSGMGFGATNKDVLDLRELLVGETTANLNRFLQVDTTSSPGSTVIHVSSTGQFSGGVMNSAAEDQRIVLDAVDVRSSIGLGSGATNVQILDQLLQQQRLVVGG